MKIITKQLYRQRKFTTKSIHRYIGLIERHIILKINKIIDNMLSNDKIQPF